MGRLPLGARVFAALVVAGLIAPTATAGMEFRASAIDNELVLLVGRGPIETGDDERLRQAIRSQPGKEVVLALDSEGGLVLPALEMAEIVARFRIPVFIGQNALCASACFLIFAASPDRMVDPTARVGVHSASLHAQENTTTMALTTALARVAATYGVPHAIVGRLVTTPPDEMAWLTVAELRMMRVAILQPGDQRRQSAALPQAAAPLVAPRPASPPAAPSQAEGARRVPVPAEQTRGEPQAFVDGLTDRTAWEAWLGGLSTTARAGAEFWAGQRSLPRPAPCPSSDATFEVYCYAARQRLAPTDVRRRAEPEYRRGWNAYIAAAPNPDPRPSSELPRASSGVVASPTSAAFNANAVVRPVAAMKQRLRTAGMAGLRVSWQECEQVVARNRSPSSAEYCLILILSAHLVDLDFMAGMGRPGTSTPGWEWNAIYPSLVRMFDVMQVPVADRRARFSAYERWIGQELRAP